MGSLVAGRGVVGELAVVSLRSPPFGLDGLAEERLFREAMTDASEQDKPVSKWHRNDEFRKAAREHWRRLKTDLAYRTEWLAERDRRQAEYRRLVEATPEYRSGKKRVPMKALRECASKAGMPWNVQSKEANLEAASRRWLYDHDPAYREQSDARHRQDLEEGALLQRLKDESPERKAGKRLHRGEIARMARAAGIFRPW